MKTPIRVFAEYDTEGHIRPVSLVWDEITYTVDRVITYRPAGSTKDGDQSSEYICLIGGRRMSLRFDRERQQWWMG